jgi:hypothetical protein
VTGSLLGAVGALLLTLVWADVIKTTLSFKGTGFLSGFLADAIWGAGLRLHRIRRSHTLLSYAGIVILLATIAMWTLLMWLGWTLLFLAGDGAVVDALTGERASARETAYFVGYTMITLGNGEFRPSGGLWQAFTVVASATGFFVITLAITYLLSVLPAVASKRRVAAYIASLGVTPQEIARRHATSRAGGLAPHVPTLTADIGLLVQQHLAFPILHYFHTTDVRSAFPLRLSALYEALSYLHALADLGEEELEPLLPLQTTIENLLDALHLTFYEAHDAVPPPLPVAALSEHGLPIREGAEPEALTEARAAQRRQLSGLLRRDGWLWEDIFRHETHLTRT